MEIVHCPKCHTRVALRSNRECPACRHQLTDTPLIPCDDESSQTGPRAGETRPATEPRDDRATPEDHVEYDAPQPITNVFDLTWRLLSSRLPSRRSKCCGCESTDTMVCEVQADDEEYSAVLPIHICHRCVRKPPFTQPCDRRWLIYCVSLALMALLVLVGQPIPALVVFALGMLASLLVGAAKLSPVKDRSEQLRNLASKDSAFTPLLDAHPEVRLTLSDKPSLAARTNSEIAEQFAASVQLYAGIFCISSEDELVRSRMPPPIFRALAELIDRTTIGYLRKADDLCGLHVQVACAALPGGQNGFEVQGLPPDAAAELRLRLSALPGWPVSYPVLLVVQRHVRGLRVVAQPAVESPFAAWRRRIASDRDVSAAEIALQFNDVTLPDEPSRITSEHIEAFRSLLSSNIDLAILHAEYLQATARHDESLALCDTLMDQHPSVAALRHLRVSCLEAADRLEHAAAECQAILVESPRDATTLGYLAHLQLKMSRPGDAVKTATKALVIEPRAQLHLVRAEARAAIGLYELAIEDLDRAVAQDANSADAYLFRARLHLQKDAFDRALDDIDEVQRRLGKSIESLHLQAVALRAKGEIDAAIEVLDVAEDTGGDDVILRVYRADFLAESGKLELALADCESVIARFPEFAPAYATRAAVHLEAGRPEAAIEDAQRALELGLTTSRNLMIRGLAQAAMENFEQAEQDLSQAIELDATNTLARYNRGRLYAAQDNRAAALEDFTVAISLYPDWSEALVQRGFLQLMEEQAEAALADFEAAIIIAPSMAEAYRGRAIVHQQQGRRPEALADLNKAILLDPDNVACRMARTSLLLDESDTDAAKADLDAALQLAPDLVPALFQRGQLHLSLGEHEAACRDFDAVLQRDPDSAIAFIGRSVAREQAGDLEQSARDADEAAQADPLKAKELELVRLVMNAAAAQARQQFDRAIAYASEAIELEAEDKDAYRIRAAAYWYSEQFVEALEDYESYLQRVAEPDSECYNGRGQVYAEMGEFELALDDLQRAVGMARDSGSHAKLAYCLNGRGRALTGLGRYEEAEGDFDESSRWRPDNAWLHYNRGLLYVARGESAQAIACFELALRVSSPALTPRKSARAKGFLQKMSGSPPSSDAG